MSAWMEHIRGVIDGSREAPPVSRLIGFRLTDAAEGAAVIELDVDLRKHANPMGTLHGGIVTDIADAAMGLAFATTLRDGETFTTVEIKVNFLRPVKEGRLRASGRIVNAGKTLALTEADVTDEKGRLIARASSTCMRLARSG